MNNESVAWIRQGEYGKPIIVQNPLHQFSYQAESAKWDDIPLYTHPAKTLTDEEIEQIGKEYGIKSVYQFAYYEFARAILRKAQEK